MNGDGQGGAFYVWSDKRNQETGEDVWAQHINADGDYLWQEDGVLVVSAAQNQQKPTIAGDSNGNSLVTWQDFRTGVDLDLYIQKLDADGMPQWDENGKVVCALGGDQNDQDYVVEFMDGIYVVWTDFRHFYQSIWGKHITTDGELPHDYWQPDSGGVVIDYFQNQNSPTLCPDGRGGTVCFWVDWRSSGKEPLQNLWGMWFSDFTIDGVVSELPKALPREYELGQNYPNPFNPSTSFEFAIPAREHVTIGVYNTLGQQVSLLVDKMMLAGTYRVDFDASKFASGVYYYRLQTPTFQTVKKMVLLR